MDLNDLTHFPIHLFNGVTNLSPEALETALKKPPEKFFIKREFNANAIKRGLFIDLSQVRWVNLGAVTQLVIFVEYALKNNVNIFLALPIKRNTRGELDSANMEPDLREQFRIKRQKTNGFLRVLRFDTVIKCTHIDDGNAGVYITEDYEFGEPDLNYFKRVFNNPYASGAEDPDYKAYNYRHVFPLTWLNTDEEEIFNTGLENTFEAVLSEKDRGLDVLDVKSIKNVIMSELIKNVKEHAGEKTKYAIFSIGLMTVKTVGDARPQKKNQSKDPQSNFLNWLVDDSGVETFIEIYFADSGVGIVSNALTNAYEKQHKVVNPDEADILRWAFEKWSTSKIDEKARGTKGLYRINRIVNKYSGLLLIRSHELWAGYQKGGNPESKWIKNEIGTQYYSQPGTFVQLKLCPYSALSKIKLSFRKNEATRPWVIRRKELRGEELETLCTEERIPGLELPQHTNVLIILQFSRSTPEIIQRRLLEETLKLLSLESHPNGIVVYVVEGENRIGVDYMKILAGSIDSMLREQSEHTFMQEAATPDNEKVYDPILVLTGNNNVSWYGGDKKIINILNDLYETGIRNFREIPSYKTLSEREKTAVFMHFLNDDSLVTLLDNEEVALNFTNIGNIFTGKIKKLYQKKNEEEKKVCTPKLSIVSPWNEIKKVLPDDEVAGYALAMYLKFCEKNEKYQTSGRTHILIDHNELYELAREFSRLTGSNQRNILSLTESIDHSIPRRTVLFNPNDQVIILTSFISSSETIRRLVKYAKRDQAEALCIICIANFRTENKSVLQTWGEETDIYSLYEADNAIGTPYNANTFSKNLVKFWGNLARIKAADVFISPDYKQEPVRTPQELMGSVRLSDGLREHILQTKSLYFNHIGTFNERHFTFYVDKKKILQGKSFAADAFRNSIRMWMQETNVREVILIKPVFARDSRDALDGCIKALADELNIREIITWDINNPHPIISKSTCRDFVYLDFGSLTGISINTMFSYIRNADNVLASILFTQLNHTNTDFYRGITKYKIIYESTAVREDNNSTQLELFAGSDGSRQAEVEVPEAKVKVEFIYALPISYYNSANCPICEHERAIDIYRMNDDYMDHFANDRKKRIRIRDKMGDFSLPTDFYYEHYTTGGEKENSFELSSDLIMKMYEFRLLLHAALNSTQHRLLVYEYILNAFTSVEQDVADPESDLYALIYFLSNEVMWLQKEPLVFRDIREMLSYMALKVATIPVQELREKYERYTGMPDALKKVIRFKYAAISLLRSSHKYRFCEHIDEMISSAVYEQTKTNGERIKALSNNLIQNIYYHINSLHFNRYNKSHTYFEIIDNKLDKVIIDHSSLFSNAQRASLFAIRTENNYLRQSLDLKPGAHASKIISHLQHEFTRQYKLFSHTQIEETLQTLDFRRLGDMALKDLTKYGTESDFYENFQISGEVLIHKWFQINRLLQILKVCFDKLPNSFFQNEFFTGYKIYDEIIEVVGHNGRKGLISNFSTFVSRIGKDVLEIIKLYDQYHYLYDKIVQRIFRYLNPNTGQTENSRFLYFLENYPANLKETAELYFPKQTFKTAEIKIAADCEAVFYPRETLSRYFSHILNSNINNRVIDKTMGLKSVDISFEASRIPAGDKHTKEMIKLVISYSGTRNNRLAKDGKQHSGGLTQFKEDLIIHDGDLTWKENNYNLFEIELKFVPYE